MAIVSPRDGRCPTHSAIAFVAAALHYRMAPVPYRVSSNPRSCTVPPIRFSITQVFSKTSG